MANLLMNRGLPWIDHLHSALKLLDGNKPDTDKAYTEVCHAIMKSGGSLTETEKNLFYWHSDYNKTLQRSR